MESMAASRPNLPSPTLTNPDMILPYGDYSRSSTPSPPLPGMRRPSPPRVQDASSALHSHPPLQDSHSDQARGRRDVTPRGPSPAGTFGHGRPLSDIEERETTPKGKRYAEGLRDSYREPSPPLASSPTLANGFAANGDHRYPSQSSVATSKRPQMEAGSRVAAEDDTLDDREDSGADKSDEESFAVSERLAKDLRRMSNGTILEEEEEEGPHGEAVLSTRAESILASAKLRLTTMEGNLSRARTSFMVSPSASTPSSLSNSPYSPRHTPNSSADLNDHRSPHGNGTAASGHRLLKASPSSSTGSPNHARVFSETSVPSSMYTSLMARPGANPVRASSALGENSSPGLSQHRTRKERPLRRTQSGKHSREDSSLAQSGTRNYFLSANADSPRSSPVTAPQEPQLAPAAPAAPAVSAEARPTRGLGVKAISSVESLSGPRISSAPIDAPNAAGLSRSRSTVQMRDVRHQVNDLKGRISSLKQRTKEDTLKRRSLQSLRTPSPFTAAEQWYTGASEYRQSALTANAGSGKVERWTETGNPYEKLDLYASRGQRPFGDERDAPREKSVGVGPHEPAYEVREDTPHREDSLLEPVEAEAKADEFAPNVNVEGSQDEYETGAESLDDEEINEFPDENEDEYEQGDGAGEQQTEEDYSESYAAPVGERHEDRADAFDYEHFYLHSGMGHYSKNRHRRPNSDASLNSSSSDESVETARGVDPPDAPATQPDDTPAVSASSGSATKYHSAQPAAHQRQNSTDSVSTVATFATAAEDRSVGGSPADRGFEYYSNVDVRSTPAPSTPAHYLQNGPQPHSSSQEGWFGTAPRDTSRASRRATTAVPSSASSPERPTSAIKITDGAPYSSPNGSSTSPNRSLATPPQLNHSSSFASLSGSSCPGTPTPPATTVQLSAEDRLLLERVLDSLRKVSLRLHETTETLGLQEGQAAELTATAAGPGHHSRNVSNASNASIESLKTPEGREIAMLRRRLDDARRILDGERHGEVL